MTGGNLKYLTVVLNSKASLFLFQNFYAGGELVGKIRYKKAFLEQLPIPYPNPTLQKPLIALVDKILAAKQPHPRPLPDWGGGTGVGQWEAEIDARVFHLYGLTEEEMLTVLNSFPKMDQTEKDLIVKFYRELK